MAKKVSEIIADLEAHDKIFEVILAQESYTYTEKEIVDGVEVTVTYPLKQQTCLLRARYYTDDAKEVLEDVGVSLIVKNAGLPTEDAGYQRNKPVFMQTDSAFKQDVDAFILANKPAGLQDYRIISIDEVQEKATIQALLTSGDGAEEIEFRAFRKADKSIGFVKKV